MIIMTTESLESMRAQSNDEHMAVWASAYYAAGHHRSGADDRETDEGDQE